MRQKEIDEATAIAMEETNLMTRAVQLWGDIAERKSYKTADRAARFEELYDEAVRLFRDKNLKYDNAIDFTGVLGCVVAMTGDIARLRAMALRSMTHGRDDPAGMRDKFMDILVQAIIGITMVEDSNWEGQ